LLLLRALGAFVVLPGVVAFAVPLAIALTGPHRPLPAVGVATLGGIVLVVLGTLALLGCVREFVVVGRGTLAPWDPPRHLVTSGPYRWSRNPMYLAVTAVLAGWALLFGSRTLGLYTLLVFVAFWIRVRFVEEPWAAQRFPLEWASYRSRTRRWL
jgi:protein-S-isoprenylcysteine O-methyltransferase Ste14